MHRSDYLIKRALFAIVTVFVAITINFFLFRVLPGSAVRNLSRVPNATPELQHSLEAQFGLDKPLWQQYVIYVQQLLHGNLGVSFSNQQPVSENLKEALANTIPMVALGTTVAIIVGVVTGIFSAWKRGTKLDKVSTNIAIAFYSFPTQWLALVVLIYLAHWFPAHGRTNDFLINPTWWEHQTDVLRHMALPSLVLALTLYGEYTLIVRSAMLETLGEDYVLTARAKGLSQRAIVIEARAAECDAADHHPDGAVARLHRRGRHLDRERVLVAGDRQRRLSGGDRARLPDVAGRVPRADGVGRVLQLPGRRSVLLHGPEDHGVADDPTGHAQRSAR